MSTPHSSAEVVVDEGVIDLRERVGEHRDTRLPLVDLAADYEHHKADIDAAVGKVLERGDFILGEDVERFEEEFAALCGTTHAVGVDSGFSALELMLRAFDIGPGDEVIVPANTFYSTVRPIEVCGATPVLVDVDPDTRTLDPALAEQAITPDTSAIMAVHLYGHPADMTALKELCTRRSLLLFEDACQAHGGAVDASPVGSLGDCAAFSFYPSKNLGGIGDGGIVVTGDDQAADSVRRSRNLASTEKYHHDRGGFNRRLDTINAGALRVKLRTLHEMTRRRDVAAVRYIERLHDASIGLPTTAPWATHVWHLFVVELPNRDAVSTALDQHGVQNGIHYPIPIHLQDAFAPLGHSRGDFPVTERLCDRILSLPMHPFLHLDDVANISGIVRSVVDGPR